MGIDIKAIEAREKQIAEQIAPLQKELEELATAKRVLLRLESPVARIVRVRLSEPVAGGQPRPAGAPTNFEMADLVLADAEKGGKDGLLVGELVEAIRNRYWPGLVSEQITPSLYGFVKAGRLRKGANGRFRRVKKNEGSTKAEPS